MSMDIHGPADWQELMDITRGRSIMIERVRIVDKDIFIEGSFELPLLARLNPEDQMFVAAFVKAHGSIKEMERLFDVSYPTIKSTLNRITKSLEAPSAKPIPPEVQESERVSSQAEILDKLQKGEISPEEAIRQMEALR